MASWSELLEDEGGGTAPLRAVPRVTMKVAEYREAVWEYLDGLEVGAEFRSRDAFEAVGRRGYTQVGWVIRKARSLGWVRRVRHATYRRVR